jgi:hypothetical protein
MITHGPKIAGVAASASTAPTFTLRNPVTLTEITGFTHHVDASDVRHVASDVTQMDGSGNIDAISGYGEYIEVTLELMPTGGTQAQQRTAMTLPPMMSTVETAGFIPFAAGPFVNAMNTVGGSRFIYVSGGSIRLDSKGFATLSLPLRRYPNIAASTAAIAS